MTNGNTHKKTFEITATESVMRRIERFFALLHFSSRFGHSAIFAMDLDGDGDEKVTVSPVDSTLRHEVDLIGSVGYHIEIAQDNSYTGCDRVQRQSQWYTGPAANLYIDGKVRRTAPSQDWSFENGVQVGSHQSDASKEADSEVGVPSKTRKDPDLPPYD